MFRPQRYFAQPEPPKHLLWSTLDRATVHQQQQSPLFSRLPAELRNKIFRFAVRAHDGDPDPPLRGGSGSGSGLRSHVVFGERALGHQWRRAISWSVQLACRRAYAESVFLPLLENELTYWWDRPPRGKPQARSPAPDLALLHAEQRRLATVHVLAQQFELEGALCSELGADGFRPGRLVLTLRYSDWWWWESGNRLMFDAKQEGTADCTRLRSKEEPFEEGSWGKAIESVSSLQTFTLHLEVVGEKVDELKEIVERAKDWEFNIAEGEVLRCVQSTMGYNGRKEIFQMYHIPEAEMLYHGWVNYYEHDSDESSEEEDEDDEEEDEHESEEGEEGEGGVEDTGSHNGEHDADPEEAPGGSDEEEHEDDGEEDEETEGEPSHLNDEEQMHIHPLAGGRGSPAMREHPDSLRVVGQANSGKEFFTATLNFMRLKK